MEINKARLKAYKNMTSSHIMRRIAPDKLPDPHVAYLILTHRCNLKCKQCNAWQITGHDDMTTAQWHNAFLQLNTLDVVKFLGGEPFVREDILQLIADCRRIINPFILQITTNGTMTKEIVETIKKVGWPGLQLRVSVDGLENVHDNQRGVPGAWAQATKTLEQLQVIKRDLGFKLGINFSITNESLPDVEGMIEYAEKHEADLIPGINVSPFMDGSKPPADNPQHFIMIDDPKKALKYLEDKRAGVRGQLSRFEQMISRPLTNLVFRRQLDEGVQNPGCRSLKDIIYVHPQGEIVICGVDHTPIGNLKTQKVKDILNGPIAHEARKRVADCPGCMQASIHILSRLYGGKIG